MSHDEWTPQTPFVSYSLGRWATPPVQEVQEEPAAPRLASAPPPLGPEWLCDRTERQKFGGKLGRAALAACEQDPRRPLMMLASTVAVEVDRELPPPPVRGAGVALVQGTKDYMEDRAIAVSLPGLDEDSVLAAVFDGHVGHTAAAFCATHLPAKLSAMLDGAFAGPYPWISPAPRLPHPRHSRDRHPACPRCRHDAFFGRELRDGRQGSLV